jgi:16S rRNA (cytidine1402-2'-O)-methyltransferase
MQPTLYIVATPIGNLSDLSSRARATLSAVAFVACEDTRHTAKLLSHFEIRVPTTSLHEHNEKGKSEELIARLIQSEQKSAAIVSDAGTPCISDPGTILVDAAHRANVRVISVPGPSALTSALAASGFLQPRQIFSAFLPRHAKEQTEEFRRWEYVAPCVAVFYESPTRLASTLAHLKTYFGDNTEICLSREISKIHEEHMRGKIEHILEQLDTREHSAGECAICVNVSAQKLPETQLRLSMEEATSAVLESVKNGMRLKDVVRDLAKAHNLDPRILYKIAAERHENEKG